MDFKIIIGDFDASSEFFTSKFLMHSYIFANKTCFTYY